MPEVEVEVVQGERAMVSAVEAAERVERHFQVAEEALKGFIQTHSPIH